MQIYIASSWKNRHAVEMLTALLREKGHDVASFIEAASDVEPSAAEGRDVSSWINSLDGKRKFDYDTNAAEHADLVIYIGPSGCDAWAEVGIAWANCTPVFALESKGEQVGLMRRLARWFKDYRELLNAVEVFDAGLWSADIEEDSVA